MCQVGLTADLLQDHLSASHGLGNYLRNLGLRRQKQAVAHVDHLKPLVVSISRYVERLVHRHVPGVKQLALPQVISVDGGALQRLALLACLAATGYVAGG